MRIGMGYDVHRLAEGRDLIVGGIHIPYEKGLLGHSDADVLLHAIADALLGAAALGDIGKHFPDNDPKYEGANSLNLLAMVGAMVEANSYLIENIDATIIAQAPKMRPYIDRMRENIAAALSIDISQINIKATTEEGLGFTGSGEGMAAQAICMLNSPREFATMDVSQMGACSGCDAGASDDKSDGEIDISNVNGTFSTTFSEETEKASIGCDPSACGRCPISSSCTKIG